MPNPTPKPLPPEPLPTPNPEPVPTEAFAPFLVFFFAAIAGPPPPLVRQFFILPSTAGRISRTIPAPVCQGFPHIFCLTAPD